MTTAVTLAVLQKPNTLASVEEAVRSAASRIAPLWPLEDFVAVNPFLGYADTPFLAAAVELRRLGRVELFQPGAFYLAALEEGTMTDGDLEAAIARQIEAMRRFCGAGANALNPGLIRKLLDAPSPERVTVRSLAECIDAVDGSCWESVLRVEIGKWLAGYFDESRALWSFPWKAETLYAAWREVATIDRSLEVEGIEGFRTAVAALPEDPSEAIRAGLDRLGIPESASRDYLLRSLMSLNGWSGRLKYLERNHGRKNLLRDLLAIRISIETVLAGPFLKGAVREEWKQNVAFLEAPAGQTPDWTLVARYLGQEAYEIARQKQLLGKLAQAPGESPSTPEFQAAFCIDVRSEVFRNALEAELPKGETIGFAGFFGMPIGVRPSGGDSVSARCPVLLEPQFEVEQAPCCGHGHELTARRRTALGVWNRFRQSAVSCFGFVETLGIFYGWKLARESAGRAASARERTQILLEQIPAESRVDLAEGALRNMGLVGRLARLVLLCGHGAESRNNPFAASLDCGACGGHAGDVNARVAAALLNAPGIRMALAQRGVVIPEETWFVAGLHNTTTDEVQLFDEECPASHRADLRALRQGLRKAATRARKARASRLGLSSEARDLGKEIFQRAVDWAEVRPEWALAGNALFIAAPRERTRGLDLEGQSFLHNYRAESDPEGKLLELILAAPMVVANWINLQYYGSSVDPERLGSGNKLTHNVVGDFGVVDGNGGDLRPGLPFQSVHDGTACMHDPLRLNVIVEAKPEAVDAALAKHPEVRELLDHGWLHLLLRDAGGVRWRYAGPEVWEAL